MYDRHHFRREFFPSFFFLYIRTMFFQINIGQQKSVSQPASESMFPKLGISKWEGGKQYIGGLHGKFLKGDCLEFIEKWYVSK